MRHRARRASPAPCGAVGCQEPDPAGASLLEGWASLPGSRPPPAGSPPRARRARPPAPARVAPPRVPGYIQRQPVSHCCYRLRWRAGARRRVPAPRVPVPRSSPARCCPRAGVESGWQREHPARGWPRLARPLLSRRWSRAPRGPSCRALWRGDGGLERDRAGTSLWRQPRERRLPLLHSSNPYAFSVG